MIQCSHCGTKNRDGSKYCSDCGARLVPQAGLVCPMCGTPNPIENVFCSKCGARLVPLTAATLTDKTPPPTPIKGLSLPSKPVEPPAQVEQPSAPLPQPSEPRAPKVEPSAPLRQPAEPPAPKIEPKSDDWLGQLRAQVAEEEAPAIPETPESQAPIELEESADWLARLRTTEPTTEELSPAEKARRVSESVEIAEEDLPDWLRAPATPSPAEPPSAARMPDWVMQVTPELASTPSTTTAEEIPDWLKETTVATEEPAPAQEAPTWFKPLEATTEIPPPVPATEEEIPDWLKALRPSEEELRAPIQPAAPGETLLEETTVEKPAWLTAAPYIEPGEEEFLPDWLRTPQPAAPVTPTPEAVAPEFRGELPDWIAALKPVEQAIPQIVETGPVETTGPLAGLRSVLPLAAAVAEPHPLPPATTANPFAEQARLFEGVFAAPATAPTTRAKKSTRRDSIFRVLVYTLLALAIIVPFFLPDLATASIRTFGTPTADLYDTIQALPPDSLVLVAFDYDPGNIGEMDLQANALVRHLMQRRAKIIAISTLETGPQIAQRVLDNAARAAGNYAYGTNYLNLGYLAGQEAGLRQLAATGLVPTTTDYLYRRPLAQYSDLARVQNWRNVALVIELAGSPEALQKWMEQVQPRVNVKMVAGVSASAEPRARAYREAKQLSAMMSGLMGAAQYEVLMNQRGLATISVGAQNAANLVFIVLIVIGNLVFLFSRNRGKAK
ncbi:MAG: zinc-ribbon domain-containing protein [Anaerolineae bacterium]|nr:zinc-ribbon domain-containing protein [Anaerolineae bacterium]